ncbi:MAG TPA: hypothetical protein VJT73_16855 [Polyangiaceae bacterium]|nr:hypothetical protein [Polyangiaceae bacterium]
MSDLIACPFCHELFAKGEAKECPACGLALADLSKVAVSHDALAEDDFGIPIEPHREELPWFEMRRGRGILLAGAVLGFVAFFAPWVNMTSPEIHVMSGADLARRSGWIWGAGVGWFVLLPMALTRRSIAQMRGARVAAAFLSAVPLVTVAVLWLLPPHARRVPIRFDWGWGLYATGALSLVATLAAVRFGGRMDDIRVSRGVVAGRGETLH